MKLNKGCLQTKILALGLFFAGAAGVVSTAEAACYGPFYTNVDCLGTAKTPVDGLKHFGYPLLESSRNNPLDLIPEIKNHANTIAVFYDPNNPKFVADLLPKLDSSFKAVIFVNHLFLRPDRSRYSDDEIRSRIENLRQRLQPYRNFIAYLAFDEIILAAHVVKCGYGPECLQNGPKIEVLNETVPLMERWANSLRTALPGIGIMQIEGATMIWDGEEARLPVNMDVYGFGCYQPFDNCYGRNFGDIFRILRGKVTKLNQRFGGYRRLSLVAEGDVKYDPAIGVSGLYAKNDEETVRLLWRYYDVFANEPMVNLVGVWIWQIFNEEQFTWFGARGLPQTRATLENFGRGVTQKPVATWMKPPVIQFNVSDGVKVGQRPIWTWSTTGATSCRSITEPGLQNMDPQGVFLGAYETAPRSINYTIECSGPYGVAQKSLTYTVKAQ